MSKEEAVPYEHIKDNPKLLTIIEQQKTKSNKEQELIEKQLFLKQLMNLKAKGKYLEETQHFVDDFGIKPKNFS
jgi:hypothetical protein